MPQWLRIVPGRVATTRSRPEGSRLVAEWYPPPRKRSTREVESSGHGQSLLRCDSAQGQVWAVMIVGPHPLRGLRLHFFQAPPSYVDMY